MHEVAHLANRENTSWGEVGWFQLGENCNGWVNTVMVWWEL